MAQVVVDAIPGSLDYKGRPAIRSKHGSLRAAIRIIVVEIAERISYHGFCGNLISFMTAKLKLSTATAAAHVNTWSGVTSLLPVLGAILADTLIGKYKTIIAASLLHVLGLSMVAITAMLPSMDCIEKPGSDGASTCSQNRRTAVVIFFVAIYVVSISQGGYKPCVQAFGAEQFDQEDPKEKKAKHSFFNWWYFGVCVGGLLGVVIFSFIQDNLSWGLGFGIPCIIMLTAVVVFCLGSKTYRFVKRSEERSPFLRIGRVFWLAAKNCRAKPALLKDEEEAQNTQRHCGLSDQLRFLNKALIPPSGSDDMGAACTIHEVEEAKVVLRLVPICTTCVVYAIVFSQSSTFFTKQGLTMDRSLTSGFSVPPAALQAFISIGTILFIPFYDRVFVPAARALTGKPAGITMLQRIATGMFISIISIATAALVERKRLEIALEHGLVDLPKVTVPMSFWWLVPQYVLFGVADVFTMVGLQEFCYDQVPNELRSVGLSLYYCVFGVGSLLSSSLITIIHNATKGNGKHSWFANNLNHAHLDYFYWLLAGLSVVEICLLLYLSKSYIYK